MSELIVFSSRRTVPDTITKMPLFDNRMMVLGLNVIALTDNTDLVYVGGVGMEAEANLESGAPLEAGDIWLPPAMRNDDLIDLSKIFIAVKVADEGVLIEYSKRIEG